MNPQFESDLGHFIELIQADLEDNLDPAFLQLLKNQATKCFRNYYQDHAELQKVLAEQQKAEKLKTHQALKKVTKKAKIGARRQELIQAMNAVGLKIRSDSQLCAHWINESGGIKEPEWTLDKVVNRCIEIKWLFDYCDLSNKIYKFCCKYDYQYSREVFDEVADELLLKHPVPEKLPWLE